MLPSSTYRRRASNWSRKNRFPSWRRTVIVCTDPIATIIFATSELEPNRSTRNKGKSTREKTETRGHRERERKRENGTRFTRSVAIFRFWGHRRVHNSSRPASKSMHGKLRGAPSLEMRGSSWFNLNFQDITLQPCGKRVEKRFSSLCYQTLFFLTYMSLFLDFLGALVVSFVFHYYATRRCTF